MQRRALLNAACVLRAARAQQQHAAAAAAAWGGGDAPLIASCSGPSSGGAACLPGGGVHAAAAGGAAMLLQARSKWWWSRQGGGGSSSSSSSAVDAAAAASASGTDDSSSTAEAAAAAAASPPAPPTLDELPANGVLEAADAVLGATSALEATALAAAKADVWAGTRGFIDLLDWSHASLGAPWWAAIVVSNLLVRAATLPVTVLTQRKSGRMREIQQHAQRVTALHQAAAKATTAAEYQRLQRQAAAAQQEMAARFGGDAKFALVVPLLTVANATVMVSQFSAVNAVAREGLPSMAAEGLAWFRDLTAPDPFYGLPVLCAALTLALVESGAATAGAATNPGVTNAVKWAMRALALVFIPAGGYVPAAVGVMWVSSSVLGLAQAGAFRSPAVRRLLQLPAPAPPAAAAATAAAPAAGAKGAATTLSSKLSSLISGDMAGPAGAGASTASSSATGADASPRPPPPGTQAAAYNRLPSRPANWKKIRVKT